MTFSGEETRIIPRILAMRAQWRRSEKEWKRLQEAGVDDKVINSAISAFIVQVHPFVLIKEQRLKEKRKPVFCCFALRNKFWF